MKNKKMLFIIIFVCIILFNGKYVSATENGGKRNDSTNASNEKIIDAQGKEKKIPLYVAQVGASEVETDTTKKTNTKTTSNNGAPDSSTEEPTGSSATQSYKATYEQEESTTEYKDFYYPMDSKHVKFYPDNTYDWFIFYTEDYVKNQLKAVNSKYVKDMTPENTPELNDTTRKIKVNCYLSGDYKAESYANGIWYYQKAREVVYKKRVVRTSHWVMVTEDGEELYDEASESTSVTDWVETSVTYYYNDKTDIYKVGRNLATKENYEWKVPPRPGCDMQYDIISSDCEPYEVDPTEIEDLQDTSDLDIGWEIIRDY